MSTAIEVSRDSGSTLDQITAPSEARDEQQPQLFDSVKTEKKGSRGAILCPCVRRVKPVLDAQAFPCALQAASKPVCCLNMHMCGYMFRGLDMISHHAPERHTNSVRLCPQYK